jgi:pimeloyl-ACP methyl ester carboxylesterase
MAGSGGDGAFRHSQVEVGDSSLHVIEAGDPGATSIVLLHGWPESWRAWRDVMARGAGQARVIAIDLPIGGSTGDPTDGTKRDLARVVGGLIQTMGLRHVTLVGHDIGGMVAFATLRGVHGLDRVVIMDTVVPGVDPWPQVVRNPYIWHFALHAVPGLPEHLVRGREREYFDYFYDVLSPDP